jgi:hypothetical protein
LKLERGVPRITAGRLRVDGQCREEHQGWNRQSPGVRVPSPDTGKSNKNRDSHTLLSYAFRRVGTPGCNVLERR